jgi:hypothetical protein
VGAGLALTDQPPQPEDFQAKLLASLDLALSNALAALPAALTARMTAQTEKTREKLALTSDKLARSYRAALLTHDAQRVDEVRRLKQLLFPLDAPQERVLGFPYFAARYGDRAIIAQLLAAIDPCIPEVMELTL